MITSKSPLKGLVQYFVGKLIYSFLHSKLNTDWECPSCGQIKKDKQAKYEKNGLLVCTKCNNKK